MWLGTKLLAPFALLDQFLGVFKSSRPEETMAEGFGDEGSRGSMVAKFTLVDIYEDNNALLRLNAALEDISRTAADELFVDDCVRGCPALHLLGQDLVGW